MPAAVTERGAPERERQGLGLMVVLEPARHQHACSLDRRTSQYLGFRVPVAPVYGFTFPVALKLSRCVLLGFVAT